MHIVEIPSTEELQRILARLDALEAENARLRAEIARKDQIIAGLQHRLFGSSSEKLDPAQLQLLFDELVLGKPAPPPEPGEDRPAREEDGKPKGKANRRTKAERFPQNLRILINGVIEPDEVLANPDMWEKIGEEHHDELDVIKPEIFWRRTVRPKYRHKTQREQPPLIAAAPAPSIPGTLIAPGLAAQIITDKYEDHLPHYRQTKRFKRRHGIDLGRQTLNGWTHATLEHLLPIGRAIRDEVLEAESLQIDETPMDFLDPGRGKTREGRLWLYNNVGESCYFDWHAGRGTNCLLAFLGYDAETNTLAWTGVPHTDGYGVYDVLSSLHGLRHAGCLAHIRRKFTDLGSKSPEVTVPVLLQIQWIYRIEKQMQQSGAPPPCRELIRRARTRPLAEDLIAFIREEIPRHRSGGDVAGALAYASNQWHKFAVCLEDGTLELDTNLTENLIRPAKLGLKNFLFFGSLEAGTNNALAYTILANCRIQGLDPEEYLIEVLKRLPSDATREQAAALTPRAIARQRRAATEAEGHQVA